MNVKVDSISDTIYFITSHLVIFINNSPFDANSKVIYLTSPF